MSTPLRKEMLNPPVDYQHERVIYFCWQSTGDATVADARHEVLPGTLNLLILKTLATLGELHGYGIARRIEQVSGDLLELNQGTIYPALLKLEQMGWIRTRWSTSENNRRAKYYSLTRAGRKQLAVEEDEWRRTAAIVTRFLTPSEK
jgi:PadR family transcriptional regulator PadR